MKRVKEETYISIKNIVQISLDKVHDFTKTSSPSNQFHSQ